MERHRTIAASPVRSATDAWQLVTTLIANTLERSPNVEAGSVAGELAALDGLGPGTWSRRGWCFAMSACMSQFRW